MFKYRKYCMGGPRYLFNIMYIPTIYPIWNGNGETNILLINLHKKSEKVPNQ